MTYARSQSAPSNEPGFIRVDSPCVQRAFLCEAHTTGQPQNSKVERESRRQLAGLEALFGQKVIRVEIRI